MGWRFPNPALEERYGTESMPQTGENVAGRPTPSTPRWWISCADPALTFDPGPRPGQSVMLAHFLPPVAAAIQSRQVS